ncbi:MAG TPA: glycoside hydrolase family 2 TIM barrel-domain containing protein [Candidatus Dormibacteraeota bacterium]|nr:glycoside hydrolase family 2 TIM barrel-domain containing protein [Candidatus Dormibacteraeota bacterium]
MVKPNLDWLTDLKTYAVNRVKAHSDHVYYETMEEARKQSSMRLRHSLNGSWKFHYAQNPALRPKQFYEQDYDDAIWDSIQVPGHIQLQGFGKPQYVNTMYPWDGHEDLRPPQVPEKDNPVGSYVKRFTIPEPMINKPLYISFQGVETAFYVWLNGSFVGYSEDSFTPADFELTSFVQEGENKLAVEVYQRSTGSWLEDQDFWRFSGIFRDVYLYSKPDIHLEDIHVHTDLDDTYTTGTLKVDMELSNVSQGAKVKLVLEDADGLVVDSVSKDIDKSKETLSLPVSDISLWSAEQPYLYRAYIQVYNHEEQLVEVVPQQVGFRKFEMINNIMHINGERIVFRGVNRHEFNCHHGRAITKEDMLEDIKIIKQNNMNAVRTSHYLNHSYWYELCDQYGIYVIDEVNLETHGTWQKLDEVEPSWVIPGDKQEWKDIVLDRAVSMFERDKNHPSILIWSCGNESYGGKVLYEMSEYFREVDSSRLVHYEGVFHNRDYNDTSDMESRMYAKPWEIEEYLNNNPDKPFIICEYMHAMGNSVGGMKHYTDLEDQYPMYQGGFIWDYIDQGIVKKDRYGNHYIAYGGDFDERPTDYNFCLNGIVYADRKLTPQMQEVRHLYQPFYLEPDRKGVKVTNRHLFKNTDDYVLKYTLSYNGEEIFAEEKQIDVSPGKETYITLDLPDELENAGEYVVHTSMLLAEDTVWAPSGFEVAFGEYIFKHNEVSLQIPDGEVTVVDGDVNIGIHGDHFQIIFSRKPALLSSVRYAGREMIDKAPKPLFWRALTDNDIGSGFGFESGGWYSASLLPKCTDITVQDQKTHATVSFSYHLSIHPDAKVVLTYTVYANGSMKVHSSYNGVKGLPDIPIHAVFFKIPAAYNQVDWYANGPDANYIDRDNGARLCRFTNKAEDNVDTNSLPQEFSNRTGVREVAVTNHQGQGIRISAGSAPLECSVSPYTAFELENAEHYYDLPNVHHTVLTVAGKQMGVGGDDSWGAPVHEQYRISAEEDFEFEFFIEPVE